MQAKVKKTLVTVLSSWEKQLGNIPPITNVERVAQTLHFLYHPKAI
jgi:hypothetical protein